MKIGLFGYGHLGKIHHKCLLETPFELGGIYDPKYVDQQVEGADFESSAAGLLSRVNACIIASATPTHYELAAMAIEAGVHVFIEKPMTSNIADAEKLVAAAAAQPKLITQVGFVERYNPAYSYIRDDIQNPKFIEVHRLAQFNERGIEVSVVQDLMIHDIDLLLSIKQCPVKEVRAMGVKIITPLFDICNARIEFEDGAVANLTASRMSMKNMRKFRIFQDNGYLSLDLYKRESQFISIADAASETSMELKVGANSKHVNLKSSGALAGNAILQEQLHFYESITAGTQSQVNLESALRTSLLAQRIEDVANTNASMI